MAVPDEDVVRKVLAKHSRDTLCRRAVEDAWATVKSEYTNRAWYRRKSTSRALVWEHSVQNAVDALSDVPGARIIPVNDTFSFHFDGIVVLRFKRVSLQLLSSNYPTFSALLFHRSDKDLFGFEGSHRVEVAHVFDRLERNLDWIGVVARDGRKVLWSFELRSGGAVVEQFPASPKPAPASDHVLRPVKRGDDKPDEDERR
jgi:hypothetical protein